MSLLWIGVGQLYNGEGRKALGFFVALLVLLSTVVMLTNAMTPSPAGVALLFSLALFVFGLDIYAAVDAYRGARRLHSAALKRYQRVWLYLLMGAATVAVSHALATLVAWRPFSISSASMIPTVRPGDYIFIKQYSGGEQPGRGHLAAFHFPPNRSIDYFKRIIGLPGDRVQLRSGILYINGAPLSRTHAEDVSSPPFGLGDPVQYVETLPEGQQYRIVKFGDNGPFNNTGEFTVPAGRYFVLGDNRDNSMDSRYPSIGFIARDDIVGRAYVVYWSATHSRIGATLE